MAQTISDSTARKLSFATDEICDLVDSGMSSHDAAVKVAKDNSLSESQIDLVCRAYNAGTVNTVRETNQGLLDKTAAADIVDPSAVKNAIFPLTIKVSSTDAVSSIYRQKYASVSKTASAAQKPTNVPKSVKDLVVCGCGCNGKDGCTEAAKKKAELDNRVAAREKLRDIFEVKQNLSRMESAASVKLANLVDAFDRYNVENKGEKLAHYYNFASQEYAELGEMLIDKIAGDVLNTIEKPKYDAAKGTHVKQAHALSYGYHNDILATCHAIEQLGLAELEVPYKIAQIRYDIQQLAPNVTKQADLGILRLEDQDDAQLAKEAVDKLANFGGTALGSMFGASMGASSERGADNNVGVERDLLLQLMDPTHEAKLKAIRAQTMLHELAKSDDIVSSYSPQEISDAFNDLSRSAPKIINNPVMFRANMRRALQGNISPFEAKEILASQQLLGQAQRQA